MAGDRAGLAGKRSGLWFEYLRLVREFRPAWVLIENVPGLLSSHKGQDFEIIVQGLTQCGYGVAWRVLDSKYYRIAQRRRRVYIVGHLGAPCPPEILFEPEGGGGHSPKVPQKGADIAGTLGGGTGKSGKNDAIDQCGALIPEQSFPLFGRGGRNNDLSKETYIAKALLGGQGNDRQDESSQTYIVAQGLAPTLLGGGSGTARPRGSGSEADFYVVSPPSDADGVRKTPGVPGRVDTPDGQRYSALGDAVSVPVVEWIGARLLKAGSAHK